MIYRELGKTGMKVSAVGLGCWNFGNQWGLMTETDAQRIIMEAYWQGITLFDVADNYGQPNGTSELRLGKLLKAVRKDVRVVSKIGHWGERSGQAVPYTTADMIRLCCHGSLGRLQTDYLDVVLCHLENIEDPSVSLEGFEKLRQEGFLLEYGISTNRVDVLKRFNEQSGGKCSVAEIEYSIVNPGAEKDILKYCEENRIGVLIRGPLAQGIASGRFNRDTVFTDSIRVRYNKGGIDRQKFERQLDLLEALKNKLGCGENMAELAMRYVISHEAGPAAIPGATSPSQVIANAKAADSLLSPSQLAVIRETIEECL